MARYNPNTTAHERGPKKRTSIGRGKTKMASMNKHKKRSFKKYRRQGR